TGELAPVVVNVFGDDLDVLDTTARQVADALATVPGATDVAVRSPPGAPVTRIHLRPERLSQAGFLPVDVMNAVQTAYQGSPLAQTFEGRRTTDVVVILDETSRRDPETVGALLVQNATGLRLPLAQLADVENGATRYAVLHDGGRRRQT